MSSTKGTASGPQPSKAQRVLACVLCQQRKVKCDRKFPCANCTRFQTQCVPATQLPRRRRHKVHERELLHKLRDYEMLLRQNNIKFEPLHQDHHSANALVEDGEGSEEERPETIEESSTPTTVKSEKSSEVKDFWHAMRQGFPDPDEDSDSSYEDVGTSAINKAWDQSSLSDDHLILGSRQTSVDLSTLHPGPVQIFRLWQTYLDNVNPLLRVIHAPTLQGRIIEAASDLKTISPVFESLLFSIYSMAVLSLGMDECPLLLGSSKRELLTKYQFGCQQALLNCGFLRCGDRDCLTALYLYMVSVSTSTDPRALSSILGLAIRIAQRMRIDSESACAKCGVLEGEMRRRLWWALVLFDARIGELSDYKTQTLTPAWDCHVPLNVNDADLRPEMKELPAVHGQPTEAVFVVVRSEIGDYIRNASFHLDFTAPNLKPIARNPQNCAVPKGRELVHLEKMLEENYLKFCDPENPLHFMTIWDTRAYLAKCSLIEMYSTSSRSDLSETEAQIDVGVAHALRMLECDTRVMTSDLTKAYRWMTHYYFPFPAYIHLLKDVKTRPVSRHADHAWEAMSNNFEVRFVSHFPQNGPFFNLFTRVVLHAWEPREVMPVSFGEPVVPPRIVSKLRQAVEEHRAPDPLGNIPAGDTTAWPMEVPGHGGMDDFLPSLPADSQAMMDLIDVNQLDWTGMDWGQTIGQWPAP